MPSRQLILLLLALLALLPRPAHPATLDWCSQVTQSNATTVTVELPNDRDISFGTALCLTDKSITFVGGGTTASVVSTGSLSLFTSGNVVIRGATFNAVSISVNNAAQLTLVNVALTGYSSVLYPALAVQNVSRVELSGCAVARNRATTAVKLTSCGTVVASNSSFSDNRGSTAHVLTASDTGRVVLSDCTFTSNGGMSDTNSDLMRLTNCSLAMSGSQVSLNWGATVALRSLSAASNITKSTFRLNFNSDSRSLIDVDGCTGKFMLSGSTISYNLGGGLKVQNCEADVQSSKVWAHSTYGVLCGSGATVNASSTSIYRNGWVIESLFGPSRFVDASCGSGCNALNLFDGVNACINTTIVHGYNVSCPNGLNKCSQCQASAGCLDCNGLPFGNATAESCARWNTLKSSGARISYNGTSPTCSFTSVSNDALTAASMKLKYKTVTVYYLNTTSNAEVALYSLDIDDSNYTRTRGNTTGDQFCINYERVLENGAGLLLEQCLFDSDKSILFGNQTLTVPKDHTKITVSLSNMVSFDNQMSNRYTDIDVSTRRVAIELGLGMSETGAMNNASSDADYLEALRFVGGSFDMDMELPNYAVFNNDSASTFAYSLDSSSAQHFTLVLEFKGTFDTVYYDPQFGLLLGSSDSGDDNILIKVLVPVLVGGALLVVILFGVGFFAWVVWQKRKRDHAHQHRDMVNFSVEGQE